MSNFLKKYCAWFGVKRSVRQSAMTSLFVFSISLFGGCAAMGTSQLTFTEHNLSVGRFSIYDLKITYGSRSVTDTTSLHKMKRPVRAKLLRDEGWPFADSGGYRAFEGPLKLEWIALDGTHLSDTINLEEVFKERVVLHNHDGGPDFSYSLNGRDPLIYIEVNDRTVSIYMFTLIAKRHKDALEWERIAENRVLAYSKTY